MAIRRKYIQKCTAKDTGFHIDHARLTIDNNASTGLSLWTQSSECYHCDLQPVCTLGVHTNAQIYVDTRFSTLLALREKDTNSTVCDFPATHFGEFGEYVLNMSENDTGVYCTLSTTKHPVNSFLPILYAFFLYAGIALFYYFGVRAYRAIYARLYPEPVETSAIVDEESAEASPRSSPPVKARLRSLDTFRGLSIVIMIFVNYGGGDYWFFSHSAWNGLTVADLVFAWFMFIMGTSMALSFKGLFAKNVPKRAIFARILQRSLTLYALGLFLNSDGNTNVYFLRVPGVLQKFSIGYFLVGSFCCFASMPAFATRVHPVVRDLAIYIVQWPLILSLVVVQLALTFALPVPGCPTGYTGPGGIGDYAHFTNCTGGAAGYIDRVVLNLFPIQHMYQSPTCGGMYDCVAFDPEGILGQIGSILLVQLGLQAGQIVVSYNEPKSRLIRWLTWGGVTGVIAAVLCEGAQNGGWIPVNKNLWSLSYVLTMASTSYILLALLYVVVDVKHWWSGAPLCQAGMNSIALYMGHELFHGFVPVSFEPVAETHLAHLAMHLWGTSFWVLVALYLDHKELYYSV